MANTPSINPADFGSLVGTFQHIFNKFLQRVDGVLPATIVSFDRSSNPPRAQVQPAIHIRTTDGDQITRAQIASVPVCRIGGGGAFIDFNLSPGDFGLLFACDRDISLLLQNKKASTPNTNRVKSFSDSFFLPIVLNNAIIDPENSNFPVFQKSDGSVSISIQSDKVKVKGDLTVEGDLEVNGNIIINGKLNVIGASYLVGNLYVDGEIAASGAITPNVPP